MGKKNLIPNAPKSIPPGRAVKMSVTNYSKLTTDLSCTPAPSAFTFQIGANQWTNLSGKKPDDYYEVKSTVITTVLACESDDVDQDVLSDRDSMVERVNWCMANCIGQWSILPATATRTTTTYGHGDRYDDELDPPAFKFEQDEDRVLYHLKWEGAGL